jgi:predicted nuclease of restriction endonuclease-like (RecB) superfamily
LAVVPQERSFAEVVKMIRAAHGRALTVVNTTMVDLYWRVGQYISRKLETATWGEGVVEELARYIQRRHPNLRGFTRASLFRMRQIYETYGGDKKVAPLVRQLPWSHNLIILGQSKHPEEREFYLRSAIRERWGKRELERQLRTAAFEGAVLAPTRVSAVVAQTHPEAPEIFKDSYVVEFLGQECGQTGSRRCEHREEFVRRPSPVAHPDGDGYRQDAAPRTRDLGPNARYCSPRVYPWLG